VRDTLPGIEGVTNIYHLACPASPDHFDQSPIEILETCFTGTKNMLDFAVKSNAKILIASTSGESNKAYPRSLSPFSVCCNLIYTMGNKIRDLWRSQDHPTVREVLGQHQLLWTSILLRRRQANHGGSGVWLPAKARTCGTNRTYL
jgi:hypothetical protein